MCPFTEDDRHQTLRHHPHQRGGNQVVLRTHVDHAADGRHCVVGVQRGEHQMSRERGLDANLQRLTVTDFANHDDVGVVAQNRAQCLGESHSVHAHLRRVQQTDGDALAVERGDARDARAELAVVILHVDAPILRLALLIDVHIGGQLDAGDDSLNEFGVGDGLELV
jgi:hypothetical protein